VSGLSIIVPAVGSIPALEGTLVSVLQHRPAGSEVLVVLNQPYEDPYQLDGEVTFVQAPRGATFAACGALGVERASGAIVNLVGCGCEVSEGWADAALPHFANPQVAAVAPLVVHSLDEKRAIAAGVRYLAGGRRGLIAGATADLAARGPVAVPGPCSWAAFFKKTAFILAGGFSGEVASPLADADLAVALAAGGWKTVFEPRCRMRALGDLADEPHGFRYGLGAERLFWRNAPAVGWWRALALHPWSVLREVAGELPHPRGLAQLAGRLVGAVQMGRYPRRYAQLAALSHMAAEARACVATLESSPSVRRRIDPAHPPETSVGSPAVIRPERRQAEQRFEARG